MNKNDILVYDEKTIVGTAENLYKEVMSETMEYMANNEYPCLEDVRNNSYLLDELEILAKTEDANTSLYMVVWSAMHFPSLWKLNVGNEPVWEI